MKQLAPMSCSYDRVKTLLCRSVMDETDMFNLLALVRGPDSISNYTLLEYIKSGIIGVWDSHSHGSVLWRKVSKTWPVYVPVGVVLGSGLTIAISQSEYRALFLDLNNALLQSEGFE